MCMLTVDSSTEKFLLKRALPGNSLTSPQITALFRNVPHYKLIEMLGLIYYIKTVFVPGTLSISKYTSGTASSKYQFSKTI